MPYSISSMTSCRPFIRTMGVLSGWAASRTAPGLKSLVVMIKPCSCAPRLPLDIRHDHTVIQAHTSRSHNSHSNDYRGIKDSPRAKDNAANTDPNSVNAAYSTQPSPQIESPCGIRKVRAA